MTQEQPDGSKTLLMYCSRALNAVEQNFYTTHLEVLAVAWAVLLLCHSFLGKRITINMDHHTLKGILTYADATIKLELWRLRLS